MSKDFMRGIRALLQLVELAASCLPSSPAQPEESLDWSEEEEELGHSPDRTDDYLLEHQEGLLISRYPDGSVRMENPSSGVIQEERADGSLVVSLPQGKLISQRYQGEPLLVFDLEHPGPPLLGRVAYASIDQARSLVFHYEDPQSGHHLVEMSTLRYFRTPVAA